MARRREPLVGSDHRFDPDKAGEACRSGVEGSEQRAEVAARTGVRGFHIRYDPPITGNSGVLRSRCGRSTESTLTKSGSGLGRGQASHDLPGGKGRNRMVIRPGFVLVGVVATVRAAHTGLHLDPGM